MEKEKEILIKVRAIILHDGKLLGVRHLGYTGKMVALPGGHLEWGEDLKECLVREMVEELGVRPDIGRLLYVNKFTEGTTKQYIEFFFEIKNGADYLDTEKLERTHAHELAEILWVSPTDDIRILPRKFGEDFKASMLPSDEVRYIKD